MKTTSKHFPVIPSRWFRKSSCCRAFTLIELGVVLGMLILLFTLCASALCQANSQSKTTVCAANFRQWAVSANLYAMDHREWLPSFDPAGGGRYAWDVGTNLCNALGSYGLPMTAWFCPMRPDELDAANRWAVAGLGHPISSIDELRGYFSHNYPQELVINHNYWVPRQQGSQDIPFDYSKSSPLFAPTWVRGSDPAIYSWPRKLHDSAAAHVPLVSDKCGSGSGFGFPNGWPKVGTVVPDDICPNTAHFVNGKLIGVNAAFADGRVEDRSPSQIRAVYSNGSAYWFY